MIDAGSPDGGASSFAALGLSALPRPLCSLPFRLPFRAYRNSKAEFPWRKSNPLRPGLLSRWNSQFLEVYACAVADVLCQVQG